MRLAALALVASLLLPAPAQADEMTRLINRERVERDRGRLDYDARWQTCADRSAKRIRRVGVVHPTPCAQRMANHLGVGIGEVLAVGHSDRRILRAWLLSPTHRVVILDPSWDGVTIGRWQDRAGIIYMVGLFTP